MFLISEEICTIFPSVFSKTGLDLYAPRATRKEKPAFLR